MITDQNYISETLKTFLSLRTEAAITNARKAELQILVDYVSTTSKSKNPILLNFICTHNSRRSHLSQVWAQVMAFAFEIDHVTCYSGGTEMTAVFPMVIKTLEKCGLAISPLSAGDNSVYSIKYAANQHPIIGFSKRYDAPFNPQSQFAAIMTCGHADVNCPIVSGANKRIPITYQDPKAFDNLPIQSQKYMECSELIANEMYYIFKTVKQSL
ncbi:low molecular weight phosphatase family protein [Sediminibacter sp. Hel_I_10]|uniref:arsenate-mycothiol transferase ArsC n=1 Tax=Sediminibacter sp. Hel_I_10 TaxID=1392490 RepID=UPI00047E4BA4|nr:protein-tyrosine-phosphatase [Sediminibacter sp. Hel_I_10]